MPYRFSFDGRDRRGNVINSFQCNLECERCEAIGNTGRQCKRNTCIGVPYCWQHMIRELHLQIKPSLIPGAGKGLFAVDKTKQPGEIVFHVPRQRRGRPKSVGRKILEYDGEDIDEMTLTERYGNFTAPYGFEVKDGQYTDSACIRGIAALVNHKARSRGDNAEFYTTRGPNSKIALRAKKDIRNGQEIYASYGHEYRLNQPRAQYSTKYRSRN